MTLDGIRSILYKPASKLRKTFYGKPLFRAYIRTLAFPFRFMRQKG